MSLYTSSLLLFFFFFSKRHEHALWIWKCVLRAVSIDITLQLPTECLSFTMLGSDLHRPYVWLCGTQFAVSAMGPDWPTTQIQTRYFNSNSYFCTFLKYCSSIRRFLTEDKTKAPVTSYILSWLDYCNCILMGAPNSVVQPLQKVQNFAARLILMAPRHHHSTPLLKKSCTGSPFQSALNTQCMHVLPCYKWISSCLPLWTLTYLHSVWHSSLFFRFPHAQIPTIQTQGSWLSHFHFLWTLCLKFTPTRHQVMLNSDIF